MTLCTPAVSDVVLKVVWSGPPGPPTTANVPEPTTTPSTSNCTVPVGVPLAPATGATVAVKVTLWFRVLGLGAAATVVVVPNKAGLMMFWLSRAEVDPPKFVSPE